MYSRVPTQFLHLYSIKQDLLRELLLTEFSIFIFIVHFVILLLLAITSLYFRYLKKKSKILDYLSIKHYLAFAGLTFYTLTMASIFGGALFFPVFFMVPLIAGYGYFLYRYRPIDFTELFLKAGVERFQLIFLFCCVVFSIIVGCFAFFNTAGYIFVVYCQIQRDLDGIVLGGNIALEDHVLAEESDQGAKSVVLKDGNFSANKTTHTPTETVVISKGSASSDNSVIIHSPTEKVEPIPPTGRSILRRVAYTFAEGFGTRPALERADELRRKALTAAQAFSSVRDEYQAIHQREGGGGGFEPQTVLTEEKGGAKTMAEKNISRICGSFSGIVNGQPTCVYYNCTQHAERDADFGRVVMGVLGDSIVPNAIARPLGTAVISCQQASSVGGSGASESCSLYLPDGTPLTHADNIERYVPGHVTVNIPAEHTQYTAYENDARQVSFSKKKTDQQVFFGEDDWGSSSA